MTAVETLAWLEHHGVETQVVNEQIQALSVWTEQDETGQVYVGSEWVDVVYDLQWLRDWMNY